jgi:hypothetical protein
MKQALQALIDEMEYVLSCINEEKIPFDGDDFHEALRLGKEALAKQEGQSNFCPQCEALARELKAVKQEQGEPDDLTIAYMSGLHRGKDLAHQRKWVGLTYQDQEEIVSLAHSIRDAVNRADWKLKEKNT